MKALTEVLPLTRPRWLDFVELTKPRIGVMVLFTVAIGALAANPPAFDLVQLVHTLVGVALVAGGASALNQWIERNTDAAMRRTENRPIPAGRISSGEAIAFGLICSSVGLVYLAITVIHPLATVLTGVTLVSYAFIYTPMKSRSTLNTLVGAVPGALPPVIGWSAMTGTMDRGAWVLFLIVFFWQIPHFLAIAWMYRDDYARAGLKMLPTSDRDGAMTSRQMMLYCIALLPISMLPVFWGDSSIMYGFGAVGMGVFFLRSAWCFALVPTDGNARKVLYVSLVYLPSVLGLLLAERLLRYWMTGL